jgi:hypothetical protein
MVWASHHVYAAEDIREISWSRSTRIDFYDAFWSNLVGTLQYNIERLRDVQITGYSLKCFRLMYSLEPTVMRPMLQHSLLPYVVHLKQICESRGRQPHERDGSMIEKEASRMLKKAEIEVHQHYQAPGATN